MLTIAKLSNWLRQFYALARHDWRKAEAGLARQWWAGFMFLLTLAMFILAWPGLGLFSGLSLLLLMGLLGWVAWQWQAMQISVVIIVLLSVVVMLTKTASPLIGFMPPVMSLLLTACLLVAVVADLGRTRLTYQHVSYLCWSVIISATLLLVLRGLIRPAASLHYAGLPLTGAAEFLTGSVAVMMFLYLLFQRTHSRSQGAFLGLLPVTLTGFCLMAYSLEHDIHQTVLPDVVLEHGLLLIHVPAMIIAFALLMNAAGFALLRLLSDSAWLRARQNMDILETIQTGLEDYLYRMLALAVMLVGLGLLTGMLWSNLAWGHYWLAEPKQLVSLAVWLYYLAGLHFRLQKGMQMRPFAWWCVAGLPLLVMMVIGTNLWPQGLHNFAGM